MDTNADQATEVGDLNEEEAATNTTDLPLGHTLNRRFVIEAERSQDTMVDAQRRTFAARRPMHA